MNKVAHFEIPYDDQVTDFFSPHAKGKSVMFMVVIGKKVWMKNFETSSLFGFEWVLFLIKNVSGLIKIVRALKNYQHGVLWQSSHKPSSISTWNFLHLWQNENSYFNTNSSPTEVFIKLLYTPSHLRIYMWKNMEN